MTAEVNKQRVFIALAAIIIITALISGSIAYQLGKSSGKTEALIEKHLNEISQNIDSTSDAIDAEQTIIAQNDTEPTEKGSDNSMREYFSEEMQKPTALQ